MDARTVNFFSEGTKMEGDLFLPSDYKARERRPTIVLCHGFTGVRSLILGDYAEVFCLAGFVVLTFDYRGYGGSEGTRRRLIPLEQVDDIRKAISFVETLPEVDPNRIGFWGTSFGGRMRPTLLESIAASRRWSVRSASGTASVFCLIPGVSVNARSCYRRLPRTGVDVRLRALASGSTLSMR